MYNLELGGPQTLIISGIVHHQDFNKSFEWSHFEQTWKYSKYTIYYFDTNNVSLSFDIHFSGGCDYSISAFG